MRAEGLRGLLSSDHRRRTLLFGLMGDGAPVRRIAFSFEAVKEGFNAAVDLNEFRTALERRQAHVDCGIVAQYHRAISPRM